MHGDCLGRRGSGGAVSRGHSTYERDAYDMYREGIVHLYAAMALRLFKAGTLEQELAWLHTALGFEVQS